MSNTSQVFQELFAGVMGMADWTVWVMLAIGILLIWLGVRKGYEPVLLFPMGVGCILANSGVDTEKVEAFKENCEKQYGENAALNPVNIIESRKFQVTTPEVKITVPPEYSYMVETRIIDGRRFILIPADDGVEVNGIPVTIPNPQA